MSEVRKQKTERELQNEAAGIRVDVDFQMMIQDSIDAVPLASHVGYHSAP